MTATNPAALPMHELITRLRAVGGQDRHRLAAMELLVEHDFWLRRRDFVNGCVRIDARGGAWIDWRQARSELDQDEFEPCSSTQHAVLDFAIALGQDHYLFHRMGLGNAGLLIQAACAALGIDRGWAR